VKLSLSLLAGMLLGMLTGASAAVRAVYLADRERPAIAELRPALGQS
jgi:hypothetical protein